MREEKRMARAGCWTWTAAATTSLILLTGWPESVAGGEARATVTLRESTRNGASTRVQTELKAKGLYRPGLPPGDASADGKMPKPLQVEIETRFVFNERLVAVNVDGTPVLASNDHLNAAAYQPGKGQSLKAVRHVVQAASAINGEVRLMSALIRPEVRLLVAERRDRDGTVVVVSPSSALTWYELELVQGLGDPLILGDLLPDRPVKVGERWRVRDAAAQALSEYDSLTSNKLEATLESADAPKVRIRLKGQIQGSARGGVGKMSCEGFLTFDLQAALVDHLDLNRVESRQAGPVEAGLDIKSTLTVTRQTAEPPPELSDAALAGIPLEITPERELLRLNTPSGKAAALHDRHWHMFWEDPKLIVLKRLSRGQVIAQCNLMVGPNAGNGRHQDPAQFRDDIHRALKQRFVRFLGAGEIDGNPSGGYRYKVGVQGREGKLGIVWYYFLIASPEGEQLLATYTLAEDHMQVFGEQDLLMIGSLKWLKRSQPESRD
jgi:hypothetical protein